MRNGTVVIGTAVPRNVKILRLDAIAVTAHQYCLDRCAGREQIISILLNCVDGL